MPDPSKWPLSLRFPHQFLYTPLLFPIRVTSPAHLTLLDLIAQAILGVEYRSLRSSLRSYLHSPVSLFLLGLNIVLKTLFSDTLSLRSSLNLSDQVSHPHQTAGKIIVLYILIFKFLDSILKTKDSAPNDSKHFPTSICS
jgi:hypothetical protein